MATTTHSSSPTHTNVAVSMLSEAVTQGGSNLIKGDLAQGAVHLIPGLVAGMAFGPWGLLAVKANLLVQAQTGHSVLDQVTR